MNGMGKPGDEETWVYDADLDQWKASPGGGGGADLFSTQAIITRLSGSTTNSRIDRLDYVRISGSLTGVTLWSHDLTNYDSLNIEGSVFAFANSSSIKQERYLRQSYQSSFIRLTGSILTVNNSSTNRVGIGDITSLFTEILTSGNFIQLKVGQLSGITDWSSDFIINRLKTDNATDPGDLFTPKDITSLWSWHRADRQLYETSGSTSLPVTASSQAVGRWEDLSGNNRHLQATIVGERPTWTSTKTSFNNTACVSFIAGRRLRIPTALVNPMTIFAVVEINAVGNTRWVAGTTVNWLMGLQGTSTVQYYGGSSFAGTGPTIGIQTPIIHMVRQDGSIGQHYINGVLVSGNITTPSNVNVWALADPQFGQDLNGAIAEVIVYNKDLTTGERQQIEKYLGQRYNITVP